MEDLLATIESSVTEEEVTQAGKNSQLVDELLNPETDGRYKPRPPRPPKPKFRMIAFN